MSNGQSSDLNGYPDKQNPLEDVSDLLRSAESYDLPFPKAQLLNTLRVLAKNLDRDLLTIEHTCNSFLYDQGLGTDGETLTDIFLNWETSPEYNPSLTALVVHAAEAMELDETSPQVRAALMGSVLGEVENKQPYHNNVHFRKVLLHMIRMLDAHNRIYAASEHKLGKADMALMMTASCIHDLGHDGLGNILGDSYYPARLEAQSVDMAENLLKAAGLTEAEIQTLRTMILLTEVTPLDDPVQLSPVQQLKTAYRYHFRRKRWIDLDNVLEERFAVLKENRKLVLMAMLLHESDIATSAGLTPRMTMHESRMLSLELKGQDSPDSKFVQFFLDRVCNNTMLTRAGQALYDENMQGIIVQAQRRYLDFLAIMDREKGPFLTNHDPSGQGAIQTT